jgi:hypothetical protein
VLFLNFEVTMRKGLVLFTIFTVLLAFGFISSLIAGTVAGQVIDADGDPVARATVTIAQQVDRGDRQYRARAATNGRGVFEFADVPAGMYTISAVLGDAGVRDQFGIREDGAVRIQLQLAGRGGDDDDRGGRGDRAVGAVITTVYTPDRELVAGATVVLQPLERGLREVRGRTNRQGELVFPTVMAGNYVAIAMVRGGYAVGRLQVTADERNRIRLVLRRADRRGGEDRGDRGAVQLDGRAPDQID